MAYFTLSTFICIALLSCISWAEAGYSCPHGWVYNNKRCFKYFPIHRAWIDAEKHCVRLGGNLASERCLKDHHFLKRLNHRRSFSFWIGLSDCQREGTWIWSDGTAVWFAKWNRGEPNNANHNEHCVLSNAGTQKDWNDVSCHLKLPFICVRRLIY
ncbi:hypothetical protein GJAV_G00091430 [Gymnothorax javanicus]|nr:hypothetical protein GJAV_G00091430 [Gymnothorax javanicus]